MCGSRSTIRPVAMAPSHSRTYRSSSPALSAISVLVAGGSLAIVSNNPVRCPTLTIKARDALLDRSVSRSTNERDPSVSLVTMTRNRPQLRPIGCSCTQLQLAPFPNHSQRRRQVVRRIVLRQEGEVLDLLKVSVGAARSSSGPRRLGDRAQATVGEPYVARRSYRNIMTPLPKVCVSISPNGTFASDGRSIDVPRPITIGWT